jgi:hypothetical protein
VKSLDDLKHAIFQSTVKLDAPSIEPTLRSFQDNLSSIGGLRNIAERAGRKGVALAGNAVSMLPYGEKAADLIMPGAALLIRNQIVCIDDIERTGAGLDVSDILGFVSMLREEKGCKVVLLLNEEGLGEDRKLFRTYLEKVVDQAIHYSPTAKESAAAALDLDNETEAALAAKVEQLGITNIRVIKRIARFLKHLIPDLAPLHPDVTAQAIATTALLGWCVFEPALAPSLDHVKSLNDYSRLLAQEDPSEEEARWNAQLRAYGYSTTDTFDFAILTGLQAGGFDMSAVVGEGAKLSKEYEKVEVRAGIFKPWAVLGDSFEPNEAEFKAALAESVKQFAGEMPAQGLDEVMSSFRDLGDPSAADAMLAAYMEARKDQPREYFNLAAHMLRRPIDPAIVAAFDAKLATMPLSRDPKEILLKIDREKGWNPEETDFLSSMTVDDYYRLLHATRGDELRSVLHAGLMFGQFENAEPSHAEIGKRMQDALRRIGEESPLNAMRVKPYIGRTPNEEAAPSQDQQQAEG